MDIGFYRFSLFNRGGDRIVLDYANYLAGMGHRVTIHVRQVDTRFVINPVVQLDFLPGGRVRHLLEAPFLKLNHDITIVDIIHLPFLLSMHNRVLYFAQADDIEYYSSRLLRFAIDISYRLYFMLGSPVVTVSDRLSDIFRKHYSIDNLYTVNNGIDLKTFYCNPRSDLISTKQDRKAIFFLNRGDRYRKGIDIAEAVFARLPEQYSHRAELWVCGDPFKPDNPCLDVRNFGIVSDQELSAILSSCDIFVYPSRHEGFGLFPLEAMACGCAVVTTEAVPYSRKHPEILVSRIEDVEQLLQNLQLLLSDDGLLQRCKELGDITSKKYSNERSKEDFSAVLEKIVANNN